MLNNTWNKFIYKLGSPFYDKFFNRGIFLKARKQVFHSIPFHRQQKILFVGVGTGADLELVNHSALDIIAIDFSADMLQRAKAKFKDSTIEFLQMDAQHLIFEDESLDYVIASLILSVVPDADKCLQEMTRVLKQEGEIIVFDKFVLKHQKLSIFKKLIRPIIKVLGTDIGRNLEGIVEKIPFVTVEENTPIMLNGMYRKIILRKRKRTS